MSMGLYYRVGVKTKLRNALVFIREGVVKMWGDAYFRSFTLSLNETNFVFFPFVIIVISYLHFL